jgi:hypothetical protein
MNVHRHKLLDALRHLLTVRLHFRRWYIVVSHYAGTEVTEKQSDYYKIAYFQDRYTADAYDVRGWLCAGGGNTRAVAVGWADRMAR